MNQAEYLSLRGKISQSVEAVLVVLELSIEVFACDVEDVDENLHILENVFSLRLEILFHKEILATAIPE
jgi:hypothetical protein